MDKSPNLVDKSRAPVAERGGSWRSLAAPGGFADSTPSVRSSPARLPAAQTDSRAHRGISEELLFRGYGLTLDTEHERITRP